jgi:4-hydroxy-3-methylbut-2-enyl diphosphate reductase
MIKIKLAQISGFCGDDGLFGVSGAIRLAREAALNYPDQVYLVGDLVHNEHVTTWLKNSYHLKVVKSLNQVPSGAIVVVKAHGAPPDFFALAATKKITLIDATCPMVKAAQNLVKQIIASGKKVLYLASSKTHDEAISVSRQVTKGVKVVELDELDTLTIKHPHQTVVLTQTTLSMLETAAKFQALQQKYPDLTIRPHLCQATTNRQQAVLDMAPQVDLFLIVGAPHSSNSKRLLEIAQTTTKPAYALNDVTQINPNWFDPSVFTVGIVAGASTPSWITQSIITHLKNLA